jgi:hypothetical protein
MMGRLDRDQGQLFYSFCLEEVVPNDHPVREIAAVLDLSWVHTESAPHYSRLGRPSIDPVLMLRMLTVRQINLHFPAPQPLRANGKYITDCGAHTLAQSPCFAAARLGSGFAGAAS